MARNDAKDAKGGRPPYADGSLPVLSWFVRRNYRAHVVLSEAKDLAFQHYPSWKARSFASLRTTWAMPESGGCTIKCGSCHPRSRRTHRTAIERTTIALLA